MRMANTTPAKLDTIEAMGKVAAVASRLIAGLSPEEAFPILWNLGYELWQKLEEHRCTE